jgi:SAM-dependent methyltransferase
MISMNDSDRSNKLNLGSGEYPKEGYVNVDYFSIAEPDVRHNLEAFPYPFEDDYFEIIEADHVLEHLNNPFQVMKELFRISADGATIEVRVPHFSRGFTHCDHKRGFDVTFPYYFDPNFKGGYQNVPLSLRAMKLHWFAQPYLKKMTLPRAIYYFGKAFGSFIDLFANLSPWFCSRIWCFWVGGFEEIEFIFRVEKKQPEE